MKKRLFSFIICALLSMTLLSGGAWAEVAKLAVIAGTPVLEGEYWKNNADNTGVEAADAGSANAYYQDGTLYLNDLDVTSSAVLSPNDPMSYAIFLSGDLTLNLSGTNTVSTTDSENQINAALLVKGNLSVTGDGSLTASASAASADGFSVGVYVEDDLTADSGTLIGKGDNAESIDDPAARLSVGIIAYGDITASGSAVIRGVGGNAINSSIGIASYGTAAATDTAEICGISGSADTTSTGIQSAGIAASGSAAISGTGGESIKDSHGIYNLDSIAASGSASISGTGGSGDNASFGIYQYGETTATDSSEISGVGGASGNVSYGIFNPGTIEVSDAATVSGVGGSSAGSSYGVTTGSLKDSGSDALTVSGGTLTATGGSGANNSIAIYLGSGGMVCSDGLIIAKADGESNNPQTVSTHGLDLPESFYWRTSPSEGYKHYPEDGFPLPEFFYSNQPPEILSGTYLELRKTLPAVNIPYYTYTVETTDKGFVINADIEKFVSIRLDGQVLDGESYTLTYADGKLLITLDPDFLKTLPKGEHTLLIYFTDGCGEVKFTVK